MSMLLATLALPALVASTSCDETYSWPQWDGPKLSGISTETEWESTGKEESLWSAELGLGYSTVAVQDGRLFSMGYDKDSGLDTVWCLDALTGKEVWKHSYASKIWDRAHEGGTVNTPSIDGDVVYSLNREGNLFCFKAATGDIIWHTFLMPEDNPHKLEYPTWGFSASPLVIGDALYLNCGRLLSIDKKTGKVLWTSKDFGHGYGTPVAFEEDGEAMLAVLNGTEFGVVLQEDGAEVDSMEFTGKQRGINASTPVMIDGSFFIASGMIPAAARVGFVDGGLEEAWRNREMVTSFSGCIRVDNHLYGFDQKVLKCIDFAGETAWQERGIGNGAVLAAGDRLLVMGGTGELIVAKATAEKFDELSRVMLFEEGRFWTKPVLVNGIVYCRNSKGRMVARDHRKQ